MDFALILDIVVIVILLISSVVAFLRGFVRETLTIIGLVGAVLAGLTLGPVLAPTVESWFTDGLTDEAAKDGLWGVVPYDIAAGAIAYMGLFIVTLTILSVISHYIAKSVHAIGMGPVDRSLGVVFGLVRGAVLIGLLFLPFHILMEADSKEETFSESHSYSYVQQTSDIMLALIPESWGGAAEQAKEKTELLKDLTGDENLEEAAETLSNMIGTDEAAAEAGMGYNDMERETIDQLIKNQDQLQNMLQEQLQKMNEINGEKNNENE